MIASAYEYVTDTGGMPHEIELARYVDRFGVEAVFGRVMGAGEIRRIMTAEAVIGAYKSRQKSENWAGWVVEHPGEAELLAHAEELVNNG